MHERIERIGADGVQHGLGPRQDWRATLRDGEAVHRELRPRLGPDYCGYLAMLLGEGAFITQLVDEEEEVRAIALWRVFHTTYCGRRLEIDDLVTAEVHRSRGFGAVLLHWLERRAVMLGCPTLTLNSAMHRLDAHRFYEREGYPKIAYHFSKSLPAD